METSNLLFCAFRELLGSTWHKTSTTSPPTTGRSDGRVTGPNGFLSDSENSMSVGKYNVYLYVLLSCGPLHLNYYVLFRWIRI